MKELFPRIWEKSRRAILFCKVEEQVALSANPVAQQLFAQEDGTLPVDRIFPQNVVAPFVLSQVGEKLSQQDPVTIPDVVTKTGAGSLKLCDLVVGYADVERSILYLECSFKEDHRMKRAEEQVNSSSRAEGILLFDEHLTMIHCNQSMHDVFQGDAISQQELYGCRFLNAFPQEDRQEILGEIRRGLEESDRFQRKTRIVITTGAVLWYHMEIQRRFTDDMGEKLMLYLVDIHHHVQVEQELKAVNSLFYALQDLSDDLLYRIDIPRKKLIRRSDKAKVFGLNETEVDFPDAVLAGGAICPEDELLYRNFAETALSGQGGTVELRMKQQGSQGYDYRRLTWIPVENEQGQVREILGKLVNVQAVKELEEQANYDALTATLNKRAMMEQVTRHIERSAKGAQHALFFLDLDDFKYVNDHLGHAFGDFLLAQVGQRLMDKVRQGDLVGRVGGDEFILFMEDIPSEEVARTKAKLVLRGVSEEIAQGEKRHNIHASIGISMYPHHGTTYQQLYHHADLALYQSKNQGKNVAHVYQETLG